MATQLVLPIALSFATSVGAAGCAPERQQDEVSKEDLAAIWHSAPPSPAAPAVQPMAVKEGSPPLAYWLESGAVVRVTDVGQKLDVARGFVPGRSVVRVDARRGVIFGTETAYPGPLPEGSRYLISVEPDTEYVVKQEPVQVRPRRKR
jgi:hypothetical protein